MKNYDHNKIEKKWQKEWEKEGIYEAKNNSKGNKQEKFYSLIEFPYPSGDGLHVGHPRPYIGMDIISRKRRMEGYNVLYPIGWDAFGLPTENYAIKTGISPEKVTKMNTDTFRKQIKSLAISFDWSREINTTDPKYYKWTQWIFLQFYKAGLAYKKKTVINWCPKDKIGLANEEVVAGCCERCGTPVEKREKEQWILAITKYADRLDKDLDTVDYLPQIKAQQRNWIGKSEGSEIDFPLDFKSNPKLNENRGPNGEKAAIKIFTTRADTIYGATYMVLAPEHPWVTLALDDNHKGVLANTDEVKAYVEAAKKKDEIERTSDTKEKTGAEIKGVKAINPASGEEIPIWVADYVLPQYGTGAIMAVPAHDERDFQFAKKYGLPIKEVIEPLFIKKGGSDGIKENLPFIERNAVICIVKHWSEDKFLCLKWKKNDWQGFVVGGIEKGEEPGISGMREIKEETGYQNPKFVSKLGSIIHSKFYHEIKKQNRFAHFEALYFELLDGERVDISEEENKLHEIVWVPKNDVSKFASHDEDMEFVWNRYLGNIVYKNNGPLINSEKFDGIDSEEARQKITKFVGGKMVTKYKLRDWIFSRQRYWGEPIPLIHCDKCGYVPVPDKDLPVTLPKVKSYMPTDNGESPLAEISSWINVKCPKCKGPAKRETDTMPNWAGSSWYYLRYTDPENSKEFASQKNLKYWTPVDWYNGGMEHTTLHLLYSRFWHKFLFDQGLVPTSEPYMKRTSHGMILAEGGEKMSKSRGNVINPDDIVKTYGADTLRLYEMFMGPFDQAVVWNTNSIIGCRRFLEKVWKIATTQDNPVGYVSPAETITLLHKTIKKVSEDIETMSFNTAISAMMVFMNEVDKTKNISKEDFKMFLQILAPFAPHIADELWIELGEKKSIHESAWPKWDSKKIVDDTIKIAIQVNGKVRAELEIASDMDEEDIKILATSDKAILPWTLDNEIKRVIYVKARLVNIVV